MYSDDNRAIFCLHIRLHGVDVNGADDHGTGIGFQKLKMFMGYIVYNFIYYTSLHGSV